MTERELRRLRRADLLEMLLDQSRELEHLRSQLNQAKEQLASRSIALQDSGSIAEAALQLNGVFDAAQKACEQYLYNIQTRSADQEKICARMEQETLEKCAGMKKETEAECSRMLQEAKQKADAHWQDVNARIQSLSDTYVWLRDILEEKPNN